MSQEQCFAFKSLHTLNVRMVVRSGPVEVKRVKEIKMQSLKESSLSCQKSKKGKQPVLASTCASSDGTPKWTSGQR